MVQNHAGTAKNDEKPCGNDLKQLSAIEMWSGLVGGCCSVAWGPNGPLRIEPTPYCSLNRSSAGDFCDSSYFASSCCSALLV